MNQNLKDMFKSTFGSCLQIIKTVSNKIEIFKIYNFRLKYIFSLWSWGQFFELCKNNFRINQRLNFALTGCSMLAVSVSICLEEPITVASALAAHLCTICLMSDFSLYVIEDLGSHLTIFIWLWILTRIDCKCIIFSVYDIWRCFLFFGFFFYRFSAI